MSGKVTGDIDLAPFSHILAWVDGSETSCRAAERAAQLARSLGAKLSFVAIGTRHARDEGFEDYARIEGVSIPIPLALPGDANACLDSALKIAAGIGVPGAERVVRSGDPTAALCDAARVQGADLVVMGQHPPGLVGRLLRGSTADQVSQGCGFAVLSVG